MVTSRGHRGTLCSRPVTCCQLQSTVGASSDQLEHRMGRRVIFESRDPVPDCLGHFSRPNNRVDQAVKLVGKLLIGQRVFIVAGGKCDLFDQFGAILGA